MLADIVEREVVIPTVIESSAFGAAVLALVALGEWSDLAQVEACVEIGCVRSPIAKNVKRYRQLMSIYTGLLDGFEAQYAALQAAIQ